MLAVFCAATTALAGEPIDAVYAERVANAIYQAEGGPRAKVPYGILSVKVRNETEARRVCLNTIKNNWRRWEDAGRKGHFIDFLGNRYCPPSADPQGNINWRKNVKSLVAKQEAAAAATGARAGSVALAAGTATGTSR